MEFCTCVIICLIIIAFKTFVSREFYRDLAHGMGEDQQVAGVGSICFPLIKLQRSILSLLNIIRGEQVEVGCSAFLI